MSKNKRYKRRAKRVQGYCIKEGMFCSREECKYYSTCKLLGTNRFIYIPCFSDIYKLRELLKGKSL